MSDELLTGPLTTPLMGPSAKALTGTLRAGADDKAMVQAAKDFEGVLAARLVEELRSTVGESGLLESPGGQQMQDLFWFHLAQEVSKSGGLGVWKQVYNQMKSAAQAGPAPAASRLEHSA